MWRAEEDPRLRSTICGVEELDSAPDWNRFLAAHDWGTRLVPRFRQRVVEPLGGIGAPAWVTDPDFDLHYHVRRVRLPDGAGWAELLATAEQVAMTPFDRARALWEAVLFEGLPDGRAAYMLKLHHATSDGLGDRGPAVEPALAHARVQSRQAPAAAADPRAPHAGAGVRPPVRARRPGAAGNAGPRCGQRRCACSPGRARASAARCASASRCAACSARTRPDGSPLLRGRSMSWRFSAFDVEFAELRAGIEGRRRLRERRVPRRAARRLPALPRRARAADRADADRGPDLRARRGRRRRWQPDRRGTGWRRRWASPTRPSGWSRSAR